MGHQMSSLSSTELFPSSSSSSSSFSFSSLINNRHLFALSFLSAGSSFVFHLLGNAFLRHFLSAEAYNAWSTCNTQHMFHSTVLLLLTLPSSPSLSSFPSFSSSSSSSPPTTTGSSSSGGILFPSSFSPASSSPSPFFLSSHSLGRQLLFFGTHLMCGSMYWLSLTELRRSEPLMGYLAGLRPMDLFLITCAFVGMTSLAGGWICLSVGV